MEVQWFGQAGGEHSEHMEEARKIRRLQMMMSMVMSVIGQDPDLTAVSYTHLTLPTNREV